MPQNKKDRKFKMASEHTLFDDGAVSVYLIKQSDRFSLEFYSELKEFTLAEDLTLDDLKDIKNTLEKVIGFYEPYISKTCRNCKHYDRKYDMCTREENMQEIDYYKYEMRVTPNFGCNLFEEDKNV